MHAAAPCTLFPPSFPPYTNRRERRGKKENSRTIHPIEKVRITANNSLDLKIQPSYRTRSSFSSSSFGQVAHTYTYTNRSKNFSDIQFLIARIIDPIWTNFLLNFSSQFCATMCIFSSWEKKFTLAEETLISTETRKHKTCFHFLFSRLES